MFATANPALGGSILRVSQRLDETAFVAAATFQAA